MTNPFLQSIDDLTFPELESLRSALGQNMDGETSTEPLFTDVMADLAELPAWKVMIYIEEAESKLGEILDREESQWPPRIERPKEAAITVLSYYDSLCFITLPDHASELSELQAYADGDSIALLKAQARG